MDTKKLRALLTALSKGSLTAAAEELGYTQSGLTHMMNSLEEELGVKLLVRSKSGVLLSTAGQELLPLMRNVAESVEKLEETAEKIRQRNNTNLRVGAFSSVSGYWLPGILSALRQVNSELSVSIQIKPIDEIYESVRRDELDCAVISYQASLCSGLCWVPLQDDPLLAILPADSHFEGDSFPVANFEGEEFLMPSYRFDMDIIPLFGTNGSKINPIIRYTNLDDAAIASMVAHGLGKSILSRLIVRCIKEENILALPLSPPAVRSMGIIFSEQRKNDRNIKQLVKCAQSVVAKLKE